MIAAPPVDQPPDSSGPDSDLSLVFQHPQGLTAARSITKSLILQAQLAASTGSQASQPPAPSSPPPAMDPNNAGVLDSLFTFTDAPAVSQSSQSSSSAGQGGPRPLAPAAGAQDRQTSDIPTSSLDLHIESGAPGAGASHGGAAAHISLSSATMPSLSHHPDPFSRGSSTSQPRSGFAASTGREVPAIHPRAPTASAPAAPNSLSAIPPGESAATACHSSANSVWVRHDFPKIVPQTHQSNSRPPQPGFLKLQHSTFTSVNGSPAMATPPRKAASKKRKNASDDEKKPKVRRKAKPETAESVFDDSIYMRILEFTPPAFLPKARLICRAFKGYVDQFTSIYINQRKENFGLDMPPPPKHLTDQQYNELLGGKKGCMADGCDDRKSIRTHWSWYKRWCWDCWKERIEREDRVMKSRGIIYGRATLTKMLECIPVGMHDSFMKPHDYMENNEATRARGAPRLYRYYLTEDINEIIKDFESLTPAPYVENPSHTDAERASAQAAHQALMDGLEDQRTAFFAERKAKNDEHMAQVLKIETCIRERRARNRNPYDVNRNARRELFSRRAQEDIPHIDLEFVRNTSAYKAATRIFRDGGTERGWLTLKPKIVAEWEEAQKKLKDVVEVADPSSSKPVEGSLSHLIGPNPGARNDSGPYMRLQTYQSQLQKLEEHKHRHPFAPEGLPGVGLSDVNYSSGLPDTQTLFASGSNASFAGLSYSSVLAGRNGSSSAAPLARSQSAPSGHHLSAPSWFSHGSGSGLSGLTSGSIQNPTQITVNSLLGPSTPTPSQNRNHSRSPYRP